LDFFWLFMAVTLKTDKTIFIHKNSHSSKATKLSQDVQIHLSLNAIFVEFYKKQYLYAMDWNDCLVVGCSASGIVCISGAENSFKK